MDVSPTNTVKVLVLGPERGFARQLLDALADVRVLAGEPVRFLSGEVQAVQADFGRVELTTELAISIVAAADLEPLDAVWDVVADGLLGGLVLVEAGSLEQIDAARRLVDGIRERGVATFVVLRHGTGGAADDGTALRTALGLDDDVDVLDTDPSSRDDARAGVLALLHATLRSRTGRRARAAVG